MTAEQEASYAFGPFVLHAREKLLLEGASPVRIGSRALELLTGLLERRGEIVSRDELVARVWPRTIVEETSLRVHVSALRKTLGDGHAGARYITNVPGRGYSFVGSVTVQASRAREPVLPPMRPATPAVSHNLPPRLTRQIGRADITATLCSLLEQQRMVSVVGPGGMGKTTIALAIAESRLGVDADGVRFVDLCPLTEPARVVGAVAAALGLSLPASDPWPALLAHLRDKQLLFVLDNCEHVIGAAAEWVERTLRACPGVRIVATSREPLDTEGEWVHRLAALPSPLAEATTTVDEAAAFPAVQLFVERAAANNDSFVLDADTLEPVLKICHRLDGIPLAIELAAARVEGLGVHGLAANLDDLFTLLTRGRRTSYPRHKTLLAVLDWSYQLLGAAEREVLQRLSVFRGGFTLHNAAAVLADDALDAATIIDAVLSLTAKSMVTIDTIEGDAVRHRLLYTTHAYAARLLEQGTQGHALRRRHASYYRDLLVEVDAHRGLVTRRQAVARLMSSIDDIRAALDWSLGDEGDLDIGLTLTAVAHLLIGEIGGLDDYRHHVERALARASQLVPPQPAVEMRLAVTLAFLSGYTEHGRPLQNELLPRAVALAQSHGSREDHLEALYAACVSSFGQGNHLGSMRYARVLRTLASGEFEAASWIVCDRMDAMNLHHLGEHDQAAALARRLMHQPPVGISMRLVSQVPADVSMGTILARMAWLQGRVDTAATLAADALAAAEGAHPSGYCQALGMGAIPLAMWRGESDRALQLILQLRDCANRMGLGYWQAWAWHCERAWAQHHAAESPRVAAQKPPCNPLLCDLLGTLTPTLTFAETLVRVDAAEVGWCAPEVLRLYAEQKAAAGAHADADAALRRALELALQQKALSWQLRVACSMVRLHGSGVPAIEAAARLRSVLEAFTEGAATADVVAARRLLAATGR